MAHLKLVGAVLLLLFFSPLSTGMNFEDQFKYSYFDFQLDALQELWAEWNKSTPNLGSNLAGWSSTQRYPCSLTSDNFTNWRGILCVNIPLNDTNVVNVIIGLSLHNASIVGTLPDTIGNFTQLVTLELTGNPKLTGPLSSVLLSTFLKTVDLHDNAFNGSLPSYVLPFHTLNADLSGNEFVGEFLGSISYLPYLQTLNLARNQFNDSNLTDAFINKAQLVSLDLSTNKLTGPLPNLTTCQSLQSLVLSNNSFTGSLPDLKRFPYLYTLKLAYNNLTGNFPLSSYVNTSTNSTLSVLDLSGNQLTASATGWNGSDLTSLKELYLDDTGISGTLDIIQLIAGGLVHSQSVNGSGRLRTLSMMNNNITDVIYTDGSIENITTVIRLQGNPYCQKDADDGTRCFCEQYCKNQGSNMSNKKVVLVAAVASTLSVFFIVGVVVSAVLFRARRYRRYLLLQVQRKCEEFDVKPTIFTFNELRAATRDFHPDMKLGEGGYGAVYKGIFPNKSMVAVKQLFVKNTQGIADFLNEVVLITGMKHRNLVNLKGCCLREHQRLLVYEYVDNYDIDQVLLDFGLALLFPDEESHIMTVHVAGTKGYLAPEYASRGQLSDKVDVFSFGILCLEVLSGRRNIDKTRPLEEMYLSNWAWKLHREGRLMELVDPTLTLQDNEKLEMQHLINIVLLCLQQEAEKRPTMARVVTMLQNDTQSSLETMAVRMSSNLEDFDNMHLVAFGGNTSELTPVQEGPEDESTLLVNAQSLKSDSEQGTREGGVLELSEMHAR